MAPIVDDVFGVNLDGLEGNKKAPRNSGAKSVNDVVPLLYATRVSPKNALVQYMLCKLHI